MTTIKSRKAKGRKLQNWVRDSLRGLLPDLTSNEIRCAIMGERGADIKLSKRAYSIFPYDIECKNDEKWKKVYDAYDQANNHGSLNPLVFIKMNNQKPLAILSAEKFFELHLMLILLIQ